ncbi:uncharacterized protein LOC111892905 [Lactuca sativa]|uniref:uncharacterized protein LOC111892905 n=1 Tax=Lactuca sativa TaxID=4236 RepID=UPI000CD95268|nr:uncharacterized protein LOC111892905 [Lactuca sativa]
MRHPSFKTFKSSGATEFSGVLNPIVVLTWIQNTEKVFRISHVNNEDKDNYASAMLVGEVLLFLDGLRYEIRDFVANRDVLSFEKAVNYARKREHDLEIRGATLSVTKHPCIDRTASVSSIQQAQSIRTEPGKQVQTQNAHRGRDRPQSFSLQLLSCRNCGKNHPGECRLEKGSVVCYRCGEVGHMKSICPMKNVTCFACGVAGHRKHFCPTLTSQMTGRQASVQQPARSQAPVQQSKGTPTKKEEVPKVKGLAF